MKQYFNPSKVISLSQLVNLFPFEEDITDEVYEGQWVITKSPNLAIVTAEEPIPLNPIPENQLEVDDIVELFRSWV